MLKERLRQALIDQAQTGNPTTYKELADRRGLEPPQTIHRIGVTANPTAEWISRQITEAFPWDQPPR